MLREFAGLRQHEGERPRKCFSDDFFDVFIWYEQDGSIYGFQLCYGLESDEHSLEWKKQEGFSHNRVDDGDRPVARKKSPVILPNGPFPYKKVIDELLERINRNDKAKNLEDLLFVYDKVIEYTNTGGKLET